MLVEKLIAWVAPYDCIVCGSEGALLCDWCKPDAFEPLPDRCYICFRVSPASRVCAKCRPKSKLSNAWVVTPYKKTAKTLVRKLKYARAKSSALIIADFLNERVPYLTPNTIITHIPASTNRVRMRGYDQAALIAQNFAYKRGLLHGRLLARVGQQQQVGANRKKRLAQLQGSFRVVNHQFIGKTPVLVIDDVLTTGATLETAAKALRQAGARRVSAAVFAQTQSVDS